jgi:hypothetical protein
MLCIISDRGEKVNTFLEILANFSTNIAAVEGLRLARIHLPQVAALATESTDAVTGAKSFVVREVFFLHAPIIPHFRENASTKLKSFCMFS